MSTLKQDFRTLSFSYRKRMACFFSYRKRMACRAAGFFCLPRREVRERTVGLSCHRQKRKLKDHTRPNVTGRMHIHQTKHKDITRTRRCLANRLARWVPIKRTAHTRCPPSCRGSPLTMPILTIVAGQRARCYNNWRNTLLNTVV